MLRFFRFATRWQRWPLASQILVWVLAILVLTVSLGAFLYARISSQTLEQEYQLRALGIASSVANVPAIVSDVESGDPKHAIRAIAEHIRKTTNAAYVVVVDRSGIRFSHPNPALIGKRLEEGVTVLDGQTHVGTDLGSLGRSANAKSPIFSISGTVIGEVSVGILETKENSVLSYNIELILLYSVIVLALSALGSILLARRIKRITYGLEPSSIASLLREREALLHGIREGMVAFDTEGRISVINDEARRLLGLDGAVIGKSLDQIMPPGRLLDLLSGAIVGVDEVTLTDDSLLVVNRMLVSLSGRHIGFVVTVRDRTEVEGLIREVHAINGLSEALRAQEHEYANRLFVIAGLMEMGEYAQATAYLAQISKTHSLMGQDLRTRIESPELAALLLAKITIAAEHGVQLTISEDSHLDLPQVDSQVLLTIMGNLVDNAIDAVLDQPGPREVSVQLSDEDGVGIVVSDNGPGVPVDRINDVFLDGYSTKNPRAGGLRRGLGLALVSRIVRRSGGTIRVVPGPGGFFEVSLPAPTPAYNSQHPTTKLEQET
jgi:two-component system CitB family sensor kinase